MKPSLFLNVKSAVPGCAAKLSAAPPTTMQIALPFPCFKILEQEDLDTLQMPSASKTSRYTGIRKFEASVRRCGWIPGYACENPVASVANVARAPLSEKLMLIKLSKSVVSLTFQ